MNNAYPNLCSSLSIGPVTLRNRTVISGHSMRLGEEGPGVGARFREYLAARANGGAALVGLESSPVAPNSQNYHSYIELFREDIVPGLAAAAEVVHQAGAHISIILWHSGHNVSHRSGVVPIAPSPIPSPTWRDVPKAATAADIRDVVAAFGAAARRCRSAGVDVLEVQTATDYLLGSFLSPTLNRRTDDYGGSLENRARIVCEILEEVRREAGDAIAVGVRTSAAHLIPTDPNDYGLSESVPAMQHLAEQELVDYVSVITGSQWSIGGSIPPTTFPRKYLAEEAAAFRRALPVPVTVAGRIRTPAEAESLIAEGKADLIAMARTWIAEPEWFNKVAEGREAEIRPCISCNQGCLGFMRHNLPGTCILNPRAGRESVLPELGPTSNPKRVAIVGAGPAGLEAARLMAERGHQITLFEARDELGGTMRLAGAAPHREELLLALDWWTREMDRLGVDVRLSTTVGPEQTLESDLAIWACGAIPAQTGVWRLRPHLADGIPGTGGLAHGREILAGERTASGRVLVIDEEGGWPAVCLAETLAAKLEVKSLTITTSEPHLGQNDLTSTLEFEAVKRRLDNTAMQIYGDTLVESVQRGTATFLGGETIGPFDSIVLSTGGAARELPEDALAIGDCVTPRGIWAATHDAYQLARVL